MQEAQNRVSILSTLVLIVLSASTLVPVGCSPARARLQFLNDDVDDSFRRPALWAKKGHHIIAFVDETRKGGVIYEPYPAPPEFARFLLTTVCDETSSSCRLYCDSRRSRISDLSSQWNNATVVIHENGLKITSKAFDSPIHLDIVGSPSEYNDVVDRIIRELSLTRSEFQGFNCATIPNASITYSRAP